MDSICSVDYNNVMKNLLLASFLIIAVACGGSSSGGNPSSSSSRNREEYAEAGLFAGIAVTAALIQSARGQARPVKRADQCCAVCDKCTFPCGDTCIVVGTICFRPSGCACYDSQLPRDQRPPESDLPCNQAMDKDGTPVTVPMGVTF